MAELMRTREAAAYLTLSPQTLNLDRVTGRMGVPFVRMGRSIVYRREDLDDWVRARVEEPPSAAAVLARADAALRHRRGVRG